MVQEGPLNLTLPPDLAAIIRDRMVGGRFTTAEDVVRAALTLLLDPHHAGDDAATIRRKIDEGHAELMAGKFVNGEEAIARWRKRQEDAESDASRGG